MLAMMLSMFINALFCVASQWNFPRINNNTQSKYGGKLYEVTFVRWLALRAVKVNALRAGGWVQRRDVSVCVCARVSFYVTFL